MSKTDKEIAAEITAAALASGQLKLTGASASYQATDIASVFKKIHEAVAGVSKSSSGNVK